MNLKNLTPEDVLALTQLATSGLEVLLPLFTELAEKGIISASEQAAQLKKIDALRNGSAFDNPGWKTDLTYDKKLK